MRLVDDHPVGPPSVGAELLQTWKEPGEIARSVLKGEPGEVDNRAVGRALEEVEDFIWSGRPVVASERHGPIHGAVITLRIDHAELVSALGDAFEKAHGHCGLSASRRSGDQH